MALQMVLAVLFVLWTVRERGTEQWVRWQKGPCTRADDSYRPLVAENFLTSFTLNEISGTKPQNPHAKRHIAATPLTVTALVSTIRTP